MPVVPQDTARLILPTGCDPFLSPVCGPAGDPVLSSACGPAGEQPVQGILLINKPRGMTSFGVIARVRKLTGQKRVGHTGTLDPFADGLLVVCIGRATQVVQFMEHYDKIYRVVVAFGRSTDTQDLTGRTLFEYHLSESEKEHMRQTDFSDLRQAAADMIGVHQQIPPMYSAVKINGKPLYDYARKGENLLRKSRTIRIDEAAVEKIDLDDALNVTLRIRCSKGTYIRTLADDLGRRLGIGAHAAFLTRLACGPFRLEQAQELDDLFDLWRSCSGQGEFARQIAAKGLLLPLSAALAEYPHVCLEVHEAEDLIAGRPLYSIAADSGQTSSARLPEMQTLVFLCRDRLVAVGHLERTEAGARRVRTERVLIDLADFRQD